MSKTGAIRKDTKLSAGELIRRAEGLYGEAFDSNCYRRIPLQYPSLQKENRNAMQLAPAFLQIAYLGMYDSLLLNLAKLYDRSKAYSIKSLITDMQNNSRLFAEAKTDYNAHIREGGAQTITYKLATPLEEALSIRSNQSFAIKLHSAATTVELFLDNTELLHRKSPVEVNLTIEEFLDYFRYRFNVLKKKDLDALYTYRNKVLAHNDSELLFNTNQPLNETQPLFSQIEKMIAFPLDLTRFVFRYLDNRIVGTSYANTTDFENLIRAAEIGLQHQGQQLSPL